MDTGKKKGTYHQIRDQFYYIEIALYNQIDKQQPLYVPFFYVDSLKIHESIYNFITKGEIVFNSDFEIFARGGQNSNPSSSPVKPPYIDRTDGRNRIHIIVRPVTANTDSNSNLSIVDPDESKFPKKYWEIDMDFVVADVVDLPIQNTQRKQKMYIFVEERYQILKEKNLEWSSATISAKLNGGDAARMSDTKAAINPNTMLKEFLTLVSTNNDTMPKIKVGFDSNKGETIDKPTIDFDKIDNKNWDAGDPTNLVLIYPSANSTAFDDLFTILSHCCSSDGFPVIFDYGRSSADKNWQLISLSKFFENATEDQIERLTIEDGLLPDNSDDSIPPPPYIPRADATPGTQIKNFTSGVASRITSYNFTPMVATDDLRIMNSPLCYYDEHSGKFNLLKKDNTAEHVLNKLKQLAQKGLYTFKNSKQNPQILLNLNKTKSTGQMTRNEHAINGPFGLKIAPMIQMILDSIFLNQTLSFQCGGLTIRTPGKFVFIDRLGSGETNAFDDRFLGQWFITNVTHIFTQGDYKTELVGNKIDSFSNLWPEQDSKY
jgi:hypothetical protein